MGKSTEEEKFGGKGRDRKSEDERDMEGTVGDRGAGVRGEREETEEENGPSVKGSGVTGGGEKGIGREKGRVFKESQEEEEGGESLRIGVV